MVGSPAASVGDTGTIPDPGISHMLWSNEACEEQRLSRCAATAKAHEAGAHGLHPEKPPQCEAHAPQLESGLVHCNYKKTSLSIEDPAQPPSPKKKKKKPTTKTLCS